MYSTGTSCLLGKPLATEVQSRFHTITITSSDHHQIHLFSSEDRRDSFLNEWNAGSAGYNPSRAEERGSKHPLRGETGKYCDTVRPKVKVKQAEIESRRAGVPAPSSSRERESGQIVYLQTLKLYPVIHNTIL